MVDLTALPPDQMARHLGKPDSEIGIAVSEYMNRVNLALSEAAYRRLGAADAHRVLEIGFGTSIRREWEWRVKRGESLRNLEVFADFVDPGRRSRAAGTPDDGA